MSFRLPIYSPPDFSNPAFRDAPTVVFAPAPADGVAPQGYHATSIYPEYLQVKPGAWRLLKQSRMDCVVVLGPDSSLVVKEFRNIDAGDMVALGRQEDGGEGVFVHTGGFEQSEASHDKFAFRTRVTRESSFSIDYDELYDLLDFERTRGRIVWVLGPAVVFDADARDAMAELIERGYVHALLAGNALAVHDIEAALYTTALGQEIYSKRSAPLGHYNHLDAINTIRGLGSMARAVKEGLVTGGIMHALIKKDIPMVLAGSIRDDGPLPEVIASAYQAQDAMRVQVRKATTIMGLATQLHTIAVGNMAPSYQVLNDGEIRPVYFYSVDMSEFASTKLANRGSLSARAILTNVQDFVVTAARGLTRRYSV